MVPPTYQYCKSVLWEICLNSLSDHQCFTWSASFLICFRDYPKNSPLFLISLPNFLYSHSWHPRSAWGLYDAVQFLTSLTMFIIATTSILSSSFTVSEAMFFLIFKTNNFLLSPYVLFGLLFQLSSPLLSIFKHHTIPGSILKSFSSTATTSSLDSN